MSRIPIIRIENTLIASLPDGLSDGEALDLQAELGSALEGTGAQGVLIDLSVVEILDSFLGRLLNDVARQSRLLGAQTVVVGMQPPVAVTLVELGLELRGVRTALNVDKGMGLLRRLGGVNRSNGGRRGR